MRRRDQGDKKNSAGFDWIWSEATFVFPVRAGFQRMENSLRDETFSGRIPKPKRNLAIKGKHSPIPEPSPHPPKKTVAFRQGLL